MVHFFLGAQDSPVFISRQEQMLQNMASLEPGAASVTLLSNQANPRMEPLLVHIAAGSEEPHFRQHDADVIVYVISGAARLVSENGDEIELNQGDLASAEQPLLLLTVTAPPTSSLDDLLQARKGAWTMQDNK
jgi:quercetin dioxygenase-like cupin family protein